MHYENSVSTFVISVMCVRQVICRISRQQADESYGLVVKRKNKKM